MIYEWNVDKGSKEVLKENRKIAAKLSELFVSVFTMEGIGQVPITETLFSGKVSKQLNQIEVMRDEVMKLICD